MDDRKFAHHNLEMPLPTNSDAVNVSGNATIATFSWRIDTDEFYCSRRLFELFGVTDKRELSTWRKLAALIHVDDLPRFNEEISGILTGHNGVDVLFHGETRFGIKQFAMHGDVYRDKSGLPIWLEGIVRLPRRGVMPEKVSDDDKVLVDTVHAINNKFTAILGSTALAATVVEDLPGNRAFVSYLEEIEKEILHSANLLRRLVKMSGRI
jgi:hypothetical protein